MAAITKPEVESWLGVQTSGHDSDALDTVVTIVNDTVTKWHGAPESWDGRIHGGAVILAAHLWRRRATPGGVAQFGEDAAGYVQKHDPQAAMLLGLGGWTIPRVG